jgi:hypothetical protein
MKIFLILILLCSSSLFAFGAEFPRTPDLRLTPGSLCDRPDSYRYKERIAYCERDSMDPSIKNDVFEEYRHKGFRLNPADRYDYKIDHLIPLCAGGSNLENNLWPQHKTIYQETDPLEALGCEKLKIGKITQADLVKKILAAKRNLSLVPQTLQYLNNIR